MDNPKWELVQEDRDKKTERLKVMSGWIYVVTEKGDYGSILHQNTVFVPTPR